MTYHKIIFADSQKMLEIEDSSCALMLTSPPYFNAPFDYKDRYASYRDFTELMHDFAKETYRVLADGRIACVNCDDMLVNGEKYPIVADITKIFLEAGFRYRDKIIWRKPEGYIRISRRSGVMLQNPYPMYFYPDNLQESILIFQKGRFDYSKVDKELKEKSMIDLNEFQKSKWFLSVWDMVNRLPFENKLYKNYPAAFPEELPYRLIKLFSYKKELVLDPFLGSATTTKVCMQLDRNSIGYEIDASLEPLIRQKLGLDQPKLAFESPADVKFIYRE